MAVSGLLLDLDGVFYVGANLLPGARETLDWIRSSGIPFRFITNTTTQSPVQLLGKLRQMGLVAGEDEVFTAVSAAVEYLRQHGRPHCHLLVADNVKSCFAEFPANDSNPDFVVIGDIGSAWNYDLMDHAFKLLLGGAQLLSLHRNKYWQTEAGLKLDIGAIVTGLEYASGVQAVIVGKPSRTYFRMALASMKLSPVQVAIVGDDVETDIGGGQSAGLQGVLVQTGKYRAELALRSGIRSDRVIASIADLPGLITRIHAGT